MKNKYFIEEKTKYKNVQVDFAKDGSKIASEANRWVETTTRNRIKNLLQADSLDARTALLLINALYFKGLWSDQFSTSRTKKQNFYSSAAKTAQVDMMTQKDDFNYAETPDVQVF